MPGVVLVGNGGHARACVDAWPGDRDLVIAGCVGQVDDDVLGIPYLGDDSRLESIFSEGTRRAFVAIGDASVRGDLSSRCEQIGFELVTVVAPTAQTGATSTLGPGSIVMHGAVVGAAVRAGKGVIVNTGATIDHDCRIGDFVHIAPGTNVAGTVTIGDGAMLGIGSCVVPGIEIGRGATVGAGAVVVRDVPAGSTVVSSPAREIRR